MHLHHLHIDGFGNVGTAGVDLGSPKTLHLVVGPNEAGKTTLMRAIRSFVRGMQSVDPAPRRLQDARVEALVTHQGTQSQLVRDGKDGANGPLLAPDGTRVATAPSHSWPAPAPLIYDTVFGIDHDTLRSGGALLQRSDSGELGELLFATMADTVRIAEARKTNADILDATFSSSANARRNTINGAVSAHRKAADTLRAATVTHTDHARLEAAVHGAQRDLRTAESALTTARETVLALTTLEAVHPTLGGLDANAASQRAVCAEGPTPDLPWAEAVRAARVERQQAETLCDRAREQVRELSEQLASLVVDEALLKQADAIRSAAARLDAYVEATTELPRATETLDQATAARDRALVALDLDPTTTTGDHLPTIEQLAELRAALAVVQQKRQQATHLANEAASRQVRLDVLRRSLPEDGSEPSVSKALREALTEARAAHRAHTAGSAEAAKLDSEADLLLAEARGQQLNVTSLLELLEQYIPSPTERQRWEDRRVSCRRAVTDAERHLATLTAEHDGHLRELEVLSTARAGLSRAELTALRGARDTALEAALADLSQPRGPVWRAVAEADAAADDRFEAAEQVARLEAARATVARIADQRQAARGVLERAQADLDAAGVAWAVAAEQSGLPRVALADLTHWGVAVDELKSRARTLSDRMRSHLGRTQRWETARSELETALRETTDHTSQAPAATPSALLDRADTVIEAGDRAVLAHQQLCAAVQSAEQALEEATLATDDAQRACAGPTKRWERARTAFDPEGAVSLEGAPQWLDRLEQARRSLQRHTDAQHETTRLEARIHAFEAQVTPLGGLTASPLPHRERVEVLHRKLTEEVQASTKRNTLAAQQAQAQVRLDRAEVACTRCETTLAAHMQDAGVQDETALDAALERAERHAALQAEARALRKGRDTAELERLRDQIGGRTVEALTHAKLEAIARQEQLDQVRTEARDRLRQAQEAFDAIDGTDAAATAAEDCAVHQEVIREALETLMLERATQLITERLTTELSRMGDEGPIQRAGTAFAELTNGAFQGLKVERRNEAGTPLRYVSGLRANGERVPPSGMSDGTRDALWLALRVAAIEALVARGHTVPVVLDDIAVNLDDERTAAMLRVFAQLAEQTQVLLFTHHASVVAAAERAGVRHSVTQLSARNPALPPLSLDAPDPDPSPSPARAPAGGSPGRPSGATRRRSTAEAVDLGPALAYLKSQTAGVGKTDLVKAGLVDNDTWSRVRPALSDHPSVTTTGQKRGTRYHWAG